MNSIKSNKVVFPEEYNQDAYIKWHETKFPKDKDLKSRIDDLREDLMTNRKEDIYIILDTINITINEFTTEYNIKNTDKIDCKVPSKNNLTPKLYANLFKSTDSIINKLWRKNKEDKNVNLDNICIEIQDLIRTEIIVPSLSVGKTISRKLHSDNINSKYIDTLNDNVKKAQDTINQNEIEKIKLEETDKEIVKEIEDIKKILSKKRKKQGADNITESVSKLTIRVKEINNKIETHKKKSEYLSLKAKELTERHNEQLRLINDYNSVVKNMTFSPEMKMMSGYFAYHGTIELKSGVFIEIQIHSSFMSKWRELSHKLYEKSRLSQNTRYDYGTSESRLISLGHLLHLAECELEKLDKEFKDTPPFKS